MSCNSLPRLIFTAAVYVVGLAGIGVPAASAQVRNRISIPVSSDSHVEVPNSVHPRARLAADLGLAQADTKLEGMTIRFSLTATQEAALDQLLADLQNPSSPRYHQWLTPAQYGAQFGLSSADIAKVTAWLTGQGFTVTGVANSGTFVTFDGTVAQAQAAFATSIHSLSLNGETHFANITNPSVPNAFASVVGGITGLHNFRAAQLPAEAAVAGECSEAGVYFVRIQQPLPRPGRHLRHLRHEPAADRLDQRGRPKSCSGSDGYGGH